MYIAEHEDHEENPDGRADLADALHACGRLHQYIHDESLHETVADAIAQRHHQDGDKGGNSLSVVIPIDLGGVGTHHDAHDDERRPCGSGGDGEEQDVYILGPDRPAETFEGTVIGVYHRLNDREDKWIVTPDGSPVSRETILETIAFQEQYYMGELYLPEEQKG